MRILTEPPEYNPTKEIFGKDATYRVPKYQRGYDWEKQYIDDLIKDLEVLLQAKEQARSASGDADNTEGRKHFFGGLVLVKKEESIEVRGYSSNVTRYDIVDGQQRLTTFTIVLKLISNAFREVKEEAEAALEEVEDDNQERTEILEQIKNDSEASEAEIVEHYLKWSHRTYRSHEEMKLTLSRRDRDFFERLIREDNPEPKYDSNVRLTRAHDRIRHNLIGNIFESSENVEDRYKSLSDLYNVVLDDCEFVVLSTSNRGEANRLFSVLNDRGKGLSETDLIRSRTLEILEGFPAQQDAIEVEWDKILKRESDSEDFLRYFYTSFMGDSPPRRNLHEPFEQDIVREGFGVEINLVNQVVPDKESADRIQRMVEQLSSEAAIYFQLMDGDWPYDNGEASKWNRDRLFRLSSVLGHKKAYPILLSAYKRLEEERFVSLVHLLEVFMFRYIVIGGGRPSDLDEDYHHYAQKIRHIPDDFHIDQLKYTLRDLIDSNATHEQVIANFDELFTYNSRSSNSKNRIKHLITTLEAYYESYKNIAGDEIRELRTNETLQPDKSLLFDINQQSVEHIYPRNPDEDMLDKELEEVKNKIGNLTVLSPGENDRLGNQDFEAKCQHFASSNMRINQDICEEYDEWDVDAVISRGQDLANLAAAILHPLAIDF